MASGSSLRALLLLCVVALCRALNGGGELDALQNMQRRAVNAAQDSMRELAANAARHLDEAAARVRAGMPSAGDEL